MGICHGSKQLLWVYVTGLKPSEDDCRVLFGGKSVVFTCDDNLEGGSFLFFDELERPKLFVVHHLLCGFIRKLASEQPVRVRV